MKSNPTPAIPDKPITKILLLLKNTDGFLNKYLIWRVLKDIKAPIIIFFITRICLSLAMYFGLILFAQMGAHVQPAPFTDNLFLSSLARWDTGHYSQIVQEGYKEFGKTPFFPLHPFLGMITNIFIQDPILALIINANLFFLIALIVFYMIVKTKFGDEPLADRSVFYLSIFPTSFFFSCGLSESAFLLMSLLAFYFTEKEKWWWAGFFGILTTLTRSAGFLIAVPLILIYLSKIKFDLKKIRISILPLLFIPSGLLLFMGLLMLYGRGPLDFITAGQQAWPRFFTWPWWDLFRSIGNLSNFSFDMFLAGNFPVRMLAGIFLVSAFLILSIVTIFKTDPAYGIYSFISIIFFLSNPAKEWQLYGDMRYIAVLFPIFILLAQYGKNRWINYIIIVLFMLFLSLFATYNAMGGWIS